MSAKFAPRSDGTDTGGQKFPLPMLWPVAGRVALLHRVGEVRVGEASVMVVVSAPHRDEAFAAARFGIDAIKATVPIWKREVWSGGSAWGLDAHPIDDLSAFGEQPADGSSG